MSTALDKGQVIGVLDALGEFLDGLGQEVGLIGNIHFFGYLMHGSFGHVHNAGFSLD